MRTALSHLTTPIRQPAALRVLTRPLSSSAKSDAPAPRSIDEADTQPPSARAAAGGGGGLMGGRAAGTVEHDYAEADREAAEEAEGQEKMGGAGWKMLLLLPVPFGVGMWWSSVQADRGKKGIMRRMEETKVGGLGGREPVVDVPTKKGEKGRPPKEQQRINEVIALE